MWIGHRKEITKLQFFIGIVRIRLLRRVLFRSRVIVPFWSNMLKVESLKKNQVNPFMWRRPAKKLLNNIKKVI